VIAYAPSGVVHAAESVDSTRRGRSTWSFGGKALPCVQFDPSRVDWRASAVVLRPGFLAALEDAERVQGATIPVERTNGPILLISGGADQLWPSRVRAEIVIKRLNQHQFAYPYGISVTRRPGIISVCRPTARVSQALYIIPLPICVLI
jgi:hypothetical protein